VVPPGGGRLLERRTGLGRAEPLHDVHHVIVPRRTAARCWHST
jgi:hypothetical protein